MSWLLALLQNQPVIFYGAAILVALGIAAILVGVWKCLSASQELTRAKAELETVKPPGKGQRAFGLTLEEWERLTAAGGRLPRRTAPIWRDIADSVERYTSPDGRDGYFLTRPLDVFSTDERGLRRYYPADEMHTAPGVITSLGLLGTFLALLIGLQSVKSDGANGFTGINELISGLSGKFVTSIAALGVSVLVLLFDQYVFQPIVRRKHSEFLATINERLQFLSDARILLDLQRLSVKQARSLSNISSEFIGAFKEVFSTDLAPILAKGLSVSMASELQTELGPTLGRIDETMRELTVTVQRLETNKQESVVGELRGLIESLELSLRTALADMGKQFREALSASTKDEFGELAKVVQGSAGVLESMMKSFATLESTLRTVVQEARSSTTDQMTASVEQTKRLNELVEGLMLRLNDAAKQNFDSVGAVLTTVVTRLADQVTELSKDLANTVTLATQKSEATATGVFQKAGEWSDQTGAQLSELLALLKAKSVDFDHAGETLVRAESILAATLDKSNTAIAALGSASSQVRLYTDGLAGLQVKLNDGQQIQLQLATQARAAVEELTKSTERQAEIVERYRESIVKYEAVYGGLDQELDRTLTVILDKMQQYTKGVELSLDKVMTATNKHLPAIAEVLSDANSNLAERLEELTDQVEKISAALAAGTSKLKSA